MHDEVCRVQAQAQADCAAEQTDHEVHAHVLATAKMAILGKLATTAVRSKSVHSMGEVRHRCMMRCAGPKLTVL